MDKFQEAEFPFSTLDEGVLSPYDTFEADFEKPAWFSADSTVA
jgi:hypothetical protein